MLQTLGTKPIDCADSQCGDWSSNREYSIFLPSNYDAETPYPLVFLGPGCGGDSTQIYSYSPSNGATVGDESADNRVIRIGLRPSAEIQAVHATNPNQGCFDDKEGDDSVDFVFYEDLYDLLETQLCFDRNRVFAGGNSSGAWLANELGCKYAGDSQRPIRGILPNGGGLPDQPQFMPTCSDKPMAGFWVFEVADTTHPFEPNHYAINHAMSANGCPMFATYDTADFENYPVDGLAENTCQTISNCDPFNPLVVCKLPGTGNNSHDEVVNPGAATFLQSFLAPPLAAP
jgi:predicted esterase